MKHIKYILTTLLFTFFISFAYSVDKIATLDVIQSRTILLDSRINLAISERNFFISQFNLLSAIGRLTAKQLNLMQ